VEAGQHLLLLLLPLPAVAALPSAHELAPVPAQQQLLLQLPHQLAMLHCKQQHAAAAARWQLGQQLPRLQHVQPAAVHAGEPEHWLHVELLLQQQQHAPAVPGPAVAAYLQLSQLLWPPRASPHDVPLHVALLLQHPEQPVDGCAPMWSVAKPSHSPVR
jgi:hypothetical protein